jgi:hypothetical protein
MTKKRDTAGYIGHPKQKTGGGSLGRREQGNAFQGETDEPVAT